MVRRDLSSRDASEYAGSELEYVIQRDKKKASPEVPSVTVKEAMSEKRVFSSDSTRDVTRVLFVSQNIDLLSPTQQTLDGYVDVSDLFDEVHVLILRQGIKPKKPVLRVSDNVWLYTSASKAWWQTSRAALEMAEQELEFANGFRPDLLVALDPFESAWVVNKLGERYNRPTQLHIQDDYSTSEFLLKDKFNKWRIFLPFFTVPKFSSVRVSTTKLCERIQNNFKIKDLDLLPKYQDYESLITREDSIDLKTTYQPLIFFMVYAGRLDSDSGLDELLDAAQGLLQNPRIGLLVLSDGKMRGVFEKKVKTLGIEDQVVFIKNNKDIVPYLKSANLLVVSDVDSESEEVVLKGAACGIPMVLAKTQKREDVFENGESVLFYNKGDRTTLFGAVNTLLNDIGLRKQFSLSTQGIIEQEFHSDPEEYRQAYRDSIEKAFFID
tara:strand:+ start:5295 stop:6608 length:1314 start_codon:yes stop_codon:yes gene_type:complete